MSEPSRDSLEKATTAFDRVVEHGSSFFCSCYEGDISDIYAEARKKVINSFATFLDEAKSNQEAVIAEKDARIKALEAQVNLMAKELKLEREGKVTFVKYPPETETA